MKILVIGGAGLLGHRLLLSAHARKWEAHGTFKDVKLDYTWARWHEVDVADEAGTLAVLDEVKPDAVIFTAAFHKVDACEDNKTLCYDINVRAPLYVAKWCKENSSRFVFISTDYVFAGDNDGLYSETDEPAPASFYALCKRFTEQVLLSDSAGRLVVRTGVIYGHHPVKSNFVSWLISEVKAGKAVKVFDDQSNCPTLANDLAEAILRLLEKKTDGLYHTTGSECLNRYEFALKIADAYQLDKTKITAIKTAELHQKAARPENACLNISKLVGATGTHMSNAAEGLAQMKKDIEADAPKKAKK